MTGRLVNFFNTVDFALATGTLPLGIPGNWEVNNKINKPEGAYTGSPLWYYDGTNGWHIVDPEHNLRYIVTDSQESRAMIARSRTKAVGALAGVGGIISGSIDLQAQFGFGTALDEHSAQWTRPIQTSRPYFQQVLQSCQIQPAP